MAPKPEVKQARASDFQSMSKDERNRAPLLGHAEIVYERRVHKPLFYGEGGRTVGEIIDNMLQDTTESGILVRVTVELSKE